MAMLSVVGALVCIAPAISATARADSGGVGPGGTSADQSRATDKNLTPARYTRLWEQISPADRRWAHEVSYCESGRDPNALALGGDYRGAFMFTWDAWKTSPKTPGGDPIDYSYKTQAVVAVALKGRDGTAPWPVCG
ncbi:MAG: hypothetical protein QOI10_171 [Solirubrobacterales bacterium]|jgi:hypothetical protein|nr:hypothetical protein [Solirubrobacterales bacterium]